MSERKELAARLREMVAGAIAGGTGFKLNDLARAADLLDPPARGRTVRVRIAVATNADGQWSACGMQNLSDEDAKYAACEGVDGIEEVSWVTANVPLPEETTVEGMVQP